MRLHLSGKIHHDNLDLGTIEIDILGPGIPPEAAPGDNLGEVGIHIHDQAVLYTLDQVDLRTYDRVDPDTRRSLGLDTNDDRPFLK